MTKHEWLFWTGLAVSCVCPIFAFLVWWPLLIYAWHYWMG